MSESRSASQANTSQKTQRLESESTESRVRKHAGASQKTRRRESESISLCESPNLFSSQPSLTSRRPTCAEPPADSGQQNPTHEPYFAQLGFAVTRKAPRFAGLRVPRRRPTHGSKTRHTNLILLLSQDLPSLGKLRASPAYAYTGAGRLTAAKPDTRTFFG